MASRIDLSNVSFDGVYVTGFDFIGFTGISIDPSTLQSRNFTDAKFRERYSLNNILTSFEGLDTCTYRGKVFRSAYDGCKDEMKEELGKVYQKIDNAIANSKRNN